MDAQEDLSKQILRSSLNDWKHKNIRRNKIYTFYSSRVLKFSMKKWQLGTLESERLEQGDRAEDNRAPLLGYLHDSPLRNLTDPANWTWILISHGSHLFSTLAAR